jgi:hypothetical protein
MPAKNRHPRACIKRGEVGAVERNRTSTSKLTATSTLRVYHFRHDREFPRLSILDMAIACPIGKRVGLLP